MLNDVEYAKIAVSVAAVDKLKSGHIIGLGAGSTVNWFLYALAFKLRQCPDFELSCFASAEQTKALAEKLRLPLIDEHEFDSK